MTKPISIAITVLLAGILILLACIFFRGPRYEYRTIHVKLLDGEKVVSVTKAEVKGVTLDLPEASQAALKEAPDLGQVWVPYTLLVNAFGKAGFKIESVQDKEKIRNVVFKREN
jgi:hypothetical protein